MTRENATAIERHNARMGSRVQRTLQRLWVIYLLGPLCVFLARTLFRVRVEGADRLDRLGGRAILAARHFFEWDPMLLYASIIWTRAVWRPSLAPMSIAGTFWTRTRARRIYSLFCGNLAVARGAGLAQAAFDRAAELIRRGAMRFVAIFPTGPVGRALRYDVKPGVGALALRIPEVPVVPITIVGLQSVTLGAVLRLERPRLTISVGAPFTAAEVRGASDEERIEGICARIGVTWAREESRIAAAARANERSAHPVGELVPVVVRTGERP